jgi:hypothetical protein
MVDLNFRELFPSPFAFANFGESAKGLNKKLVDDINNEMANYQPQTQTRTFAINECGWQSGHLETKYESFKEIGDAIQQCVPPMLIHSGAEKDYAAKLKVEGIWANVIFAAGGFSQPHVHGNGDTLWTGVYYPAGAETENLDNFDSNKHIIGETTRGSGNLVLKDPSFIQKRLIRFPWRTKKYYGASVSVIPRESLLVMFPTWIEHYVQPVTDNTKRYSISFSIKKP